MRSLLVVLALFCACEKKEPAPAQGEPPKPSPSPSATQNSVEASKDWVGELAGNAGDGAKFRIQVWNCSSNIEGPWSGTVIYQAMYPTTAYDTRVTDWPAGNVSIDKSNPTSLVVKTKTKGTTFPEMSTNESFESRDFQAYLDGKRMFVVSEHTKPIAGGLGSVKAAPGPRTLVFGGDKAIEIPLKGNECDGKNPKSPIDKPAPPG